MSLAICAFAAKSDSGVRGQRIDAKNSVAYIIKRKQIAHPMAEAAVGKTSLKEDLSALNTKQIVAIIIAVAVALILEAMGFASTACLGFLVVAIILYMVPHLLGVNSVKVKALIGVIFIVLSLLVGTFGYMGVNHDLKDTIDVDGKYVKDVSYDESTGTLVMTLVPVEDKEFKPGIDYGPISGISFGAIRLTNKDTTTFNDIQLVKNADGSYRGTAKLDLESGKFYMLKVYVDEDKKNFLQFTYDTGISDGDMMKICFVGSAYTTAYIASMFFVILIFSALMRRSIGKTREKMEEEGRLYPQGYGRCKNCGAIVLPGEVNCRKCGTYIDVPEEMKPKKKDRFVCSECGCEITADATVCPKCGKEFDEDTEAEIRHEDGTVDVSTDVFVCTECGSKVPANAKRCPKCGAVFDEDDE